MIKINIISSNNYYGLSQDANIISSILKEKFKNNINLKFVNFFDYQCNYADINIFLELVSNILFKYAPINILIPNQEWFYKSWIPYLPNFEYILTKSNYASDIFRNLTNTEIKYIGWESRDMYDPKYEKDYSEILHLCGKSKYKQTQLIIDAWDDDLPNLNIIYNSKSIDLLKRDLKNINYIENRISDEELKIYINKCGIHLCTSETEGFGHYINEAKSSKVIVVSTNSKPMNELINNEFGVLVNVDKKKKLKHTLGNKNIIDILDLKEKIKGILDLEKDKINEMCNKTRLSFLNGKDYFRKELLSFFSELFEKIKKNNLSKNINLEKKLNINELPFISILTPTANRRDLFKLAIYNFKNIDYPKEKIEWIIIDDGTDSIRDMLPEDDRIKYYYLANKLKLGEKRNLCVSKSNYDYIAFMDDDDYYPSVSLKKRVSYLINSNKNCVFCSTIGCFDINKYASIINVPPHQLPFHHRVSEATLCFKKKFWNDRCFKNDSIGAEAMEFMENRELDCLEISWKDIIVSLLHSKNTSTRIARMKEPNGCHFGFSDELFLFLTSLDKNSNHNLDNNSYASIS